MMRAHLLRVAKEKRAFVVPLAVVLVVNIGIAAAVVFPLSERVAQSEGGEQQARLELLSAQREFATATATLRGKTAAEQDLQTFYAKVLPTDLAGARRATYLHLSTLAREADLTYQRRVEEPREPKQSGQGPISTLTRFDISMVLQGEYDSVRQFIRDVEASDGFIIIDNVALREGSEPGSALVLTVDLSTYYRTPDHVR